jgi:TctA family transporter
MSVSNPQSRYQYLANGTTTSFAFPNIVYFPLELQVIGIDPVTGAATTYVYDTDYTIDPTTLGQSAGVNVVFGVAPVSGVALTLVRIVAYTQPTQYVQDNGVTAITQQRTVDELAMQIQQIADTLSRTPSLPVTTPIGQIVVPGFSSDLQVYDVSSGSTPQVSISPGNYRDSTGGQVLLPTVGGGAVITTLPAPILTLGTDDTVIYAILNKNTTTGALTSVDIEPGTSVPTDTMNISYQLITNVIVSVTDGLASVANLGGGVRGSQNYFYCGPLPLVDGSGALLNS